ncbi:hypothetical protein EIP86_008901 [Pleurotus ostreatoroseus]|nr:hypothetical protein EIP86_008901 [Pleurotus ostreatoroseus]
MTPHDGKVHHPLGAGSYLYRKGITLPELHLLGLIPNSKTDSELHSKTDDTLIIHIGAQPNNSPHAGTLTVFSLAFILGRAMRRTYREYFASKNTPRDLRVVVQLDLVDTAPDNAASRVVDGIAYQRSHRSTDAMARFLPDYKQVLKDLAAFVKHEVEYVTETQETLMRMPSTPAAFQLILSDRERVAMDLSPSNERLGLRCACPVCGYADKHGIQNEYLVDNDGNPSGVTFHCHDPAHAPYTVSLADPEGVAKLEANTPLRNLMRTLVYMHDTVLSLTPNDQGRIARRVHMRVTGADYAGGYQENTLWHQLLLLLLPSAQALPSQIVVTSQFNPPTIADKAFSAGAGSACASAIHSHQEPRAISHTKLSADLLTALHPPVIAYAPVVTDWAGSKLSKSLYVADGAYSYMMKEKGYLLSFARMKEEGRDHHILFREVERWVYDPKQLQRNWSIEYFHLVFEAEAHRLKEAVGSTNADADRAAESNVGRTERTATLKNSTPGRDAEDRNGHKTHANWNGNGQGKSEDEQDEV